MRRPMTVLVVAALTALASGSPGCSSARPSAYAVGKLPAGVRIAILPLANYTEVPDASNHWVPRLAVELARQRDLEVVDAGEVERVLGSEPWLLLDRVPLELIERFGAELNAQALIVGSVLAFGERAGGGEPVPEVSVSLRLLTVPGGRVIWSAVDSRDGTNGETVFGIGREGSLERLAEESARAIVATFPRVARAAGKPDAKPAEKETK
ncbi:MAG: hypothetical protein R3B81_11555 [bacterium]